MNKIAALYSNEMIKIAHRTSVWVVTIIMVVVAIMSPIAFKAAEGDLENEESYYQSINFKEELTKTRDSITQTLGDIDFVVHSNEQYTNNKNETREVFSTWLDCDEDKAYDYSRLTCANNILASYDFEGHPFASNWLSFDAYRAYHSTHEQICELNRTPFTERNEDWYESFSIYSQAFDLYSSALFSNNAKAYYDAECLMALLDQSYYDPSIIQRLLEIDPEASLSLTEASELTDILSNIQATEQNLTSNLDQNQSDLPRVLTESQKSQIRDEYSILNYKFEHRQLYSSKSVFAHQLNSIAINLGRYALIVLLVLIAGTSISQEMATGSIKSLIIAPVRRWKIFLAKLLSIITWCIAGTILLVTTSTLTTMLLFRDVSLPSYLYVSGGTVHYIPYLPYMLLSFFVSSLSLFVYILLAFMISCLSKNTGVSVAVSIGLILGASLPSILMNMMGRKRWLDFFPSINMNITNLVFPFSDLMYGGNVDPFSISEPVNNPLSFSLIYVAVLVIILLWIAYDAFTRRDIQ